MLSQALFSPGSVPLDWISDGLSQPCEGPDSLAETLAPGFVFALMLAPILAVRTGVTSQFKRATAFVVGGTAAWYAAYRLFLLLADLADGMDVPERLQAAAIGMIAGMVGSLLLCGAAALAFPRGRSLPAFAIVVVGTLAGSGMIFYDFCGAGGFVFFALWQGAVAGSVGISPSHRSRFVTH